jgi:hypothetical protein
MNPKYIAIPAAFAGLTGFAVWVMSYLITVIIAR